MLLYWGWPTPGCVVDSMEELNGDVTTEQADGGTCDSMWRASMRPTALYTCVHSPSGGQWAEDITVVLAYSLTTVHQQDTCWHMMWGHV
jgi:hypothetical protein